MQNRKNPRISQSIWLRQEKESLFPRIKHQINNIAEASRNRQAMEA